MLEKEAKDAKVIVWIPACDTASLCQYKIKIPEVVSHQDLDQCLPAAPGEAAACWGWLGLRSSAAQSSAPEHSERKTLGSAAVPEEKNMLLYKEITNSNVWQNTQIIYEIYHDVKTNTDKIQLHLIHTLSMIDCMCDLWDWSPYNREDHWSGAMRSPPSMAIWTIWESCSRRRAS